MNSPLEIREVRLRGLHGRAPAGVHTPGDGHEPSAKADIT
jgi:hypothetical protein